MQSTQEKSRLERSDSRVGVLLILPALAVFLLIIAYPFINSTIMSFTDKNLIYLDSQFIGLLNFVEIFSDKNFAGVLKNTLIFLCGATLLPFVFGFVWAILLNTGIKSSEFLRGLTLVNWIIPGTSVAFLWMWIFHGEYGILNTMLKTIGLIEGNINWLGRTDTAMIAVIIARTWQLLPWVMAFMLGGLQGVSTDVIEASRLDGAGNLQLLWYIVLPSMRQINIIILLLAAISNLQHFDMPWIMTGGGPARSTLTIALETYRTAFKNFDMGLAAAVGVVWTVALSVVSAFYIRSINREEREGR